MPAGLTSIRVTWDTPTSGATVTGYRIYWREYRRYWLWVSDQGSMDANAGDTAVTITGRTRGLVYHITIVALSNLLPSQTDMVRVTLGEYCQVNKHIPVCPAHESVISLSVSFSPHCVLFSPLFSLHHDYCPVLHIC